VAAILFLSLNGKALEADDAQLEKLVLDVAQGKAGNNAEGRSPFQRADRGPVQEPSGEKTVRWLDSGGVTVKR